MADEINDPDVFDFLISDENEVLLIMPAREAEPDDPAVVLLPEEHCVELFRNGEEEFTLENVSDDVFAALNDRISVMVCETAPTDNPDETQIVYTYYAEIIRDDEEESNS